MQLTDLPLLSVEGLERSNGVSNGVSKGVSNGGSNGDAAGWPVTDVNENPTERPYKVAKRDLVDNFEREYLVDALRRSSGIIAEAARLSRKPRRVFFELMRKHGIKAEDYLPVRRLSNTDAAS